MNRAINLLSHPAWQGVGAVSGIISAILAGVMLYLVCFSTANPPKKETEFVKSNEDRSGDTVSADSSLITIPNASKYDDARGAANESSNESLDSIGPDYHGVHQYFNDGPSFGLLAIVFLVFAIAAWWSNRWAKAHR